MNEDIKVLSSKEIKELINAKINFIIYNNVTEQEIENFLILYTKIMKEEEISNNLKIVYFQYFIDINIALLKKFFISFLVTSIIEVYKEKKIDPNMIVNNNHFLFKLIINKDFFKEINKKILILIEYNNYILMNIIQFFPEFKFFFNNLNENFIIFNDFYNNYISFYSENSFYDSPGVNLALSLKKDFLEKEEENFIILNNHYFFIKKNDEIIINDIYKKYIYLLFAVKIKEKSFSFNSLDPKILESELLSAIE